METSSVLLSRAEAPVIEAVVDFSKVEDEEDSPCATAITVGNQDTLQPTVRTHRKLVVQSAEARIRRRNAALCAS